MRLPIDTLAVRIILLAVVAFGIYTIKMKPNLKGHFQADFKAQTKFLVDALHSPIPQL